jgi:hypothetical protein
MKKIVSIGILAIFLGFANTSEAQAVEKTGNAVKKTSKKVWEGTKKGAKKVGNETAEVASKSKAKVTDNKSSEWVGPAGQDIFIDDGARYYWINEKGGRVFVSKDQLKPKKST